MGAPPFAGTLAGAGLGYRRARTLEEAVSWLANARGRAVAMAGGGDVLAMAKDGVLQAQELVSIGGVAGLSDIRREAGGLRIGALVTLDGIASSPAVREMAPLLARAAAGVAFPQIRAVSTLGGNLCQRPQCWYFRNPIFPCLKKGGDRCFVAVSGSDREAARSSTACVAAHPSDLAVALLALDAAVEVVGPAGKIVMSISHFYLDPSHDATREVALGPGQLVAAVIVPDSSAGGVGVFLKTVARQGWDFADAVVAAWLLMDGDRCVGARLAMGPPALYPHRCYEAEALVVGQAVTADVAQEAATLALSGLPVAAGQEYRLQIARNLLQRAILSASATAR